MKLKPKSKLLMIGDSVTDCDRAKPVGEGLFDALGKGYVSFVDAELQARHPEAAIRVVNMGTSGHTVRDLKARWQTDVLDQKPQWLSIMIGINDVWRQFDTPWQTEWAVGLEEYRDTLDALVAQTKPTLEGLVLMTPYFIEANVADTMRARMDEYGQVVRQLAAKHGALFVDTQAEFDRLLAHMHSAAIAWDRVHPNRIGHTLLAQAFLDAIEA
ncbi:MAG: SGNH/GDSL hydrolase family protein [Spirochaetales bacterium]